MSRVLKRRTVLRGMFQGATVAMALPYLDCFLNDNGTLLAQGTALPVRFGTWFWGLGVNPNRFFPTKTGKDYDLLPELKPIERHRDKITVFSGFGLLDGRQADLTPRDGTCDLPDGDGARSGRGASWCDVSTTPWRTRSSSGTRFRTLDISASAIDATA